MKKIVLFFFTAVVAFGSANCSADSLQDTELQQTVSADGDTGGQTGVIVPNPPKPPKP